MSQSQTQFIHIYIYIQILTYKYKNLQSNYLKHYYNTRAHSQLTIQKFTTQNSMLLIDSQIPTLTKNLSPGRIVLSAPLPTLSGAW